MTKNIHRQILGSGPPVVLLHGFAWDSSIWGPISQSLAKHYEVHLIDLPGFGKTSFIPNNYEFETLGPALIEITPKNASWLGWSMGGLLAMWVAINNPAHITKLINIASSPKFLADEDWPGIQPNVFRQFEFNILKDYEKTIVDFLELQLRGSSQNEQLFAELKTQTLLKSPPHEKVLKGGMKLLEKDLRPLLNQIRCPVLNILGSHDTLVPVSVSQKILSYLPESNCEIIKRCGHIPFLSQPDVFLKLVNAFLSN